MPWYLNNQPDIFVPRMACAHLVHQAAASDTREHYDAGGTVAVLLWGPASASNTPNPARACARLEHKCKQPAPTGSQAKCARRARFFILHCGASRTGHWRLYLACLPTDYRWRFHLRRRVSGSGEGADR